MGVPYIVCQGRRRLAGALLPGGHARRTSSCSRTRPATSSSAARCTAARASRSAATSSPSWPSAARRSRTWRGWRTSTRRRSARCSSRSRSRPRTGWPSCGPGRSRPARPRAASARRLRSPGVSGLIEAKQRLREHAEHHLRVAAMEDLRGRYPAGTTAPYRERGGLLWRYALRPAVPAAAVGGQGAGDARAGHDRRALGLDAAGAQPERPVGPAGQPAALRASAPAGRGAAARAGRSPRRRRAGPGPGTPSTR